MRPLFRIAFLIAVTPFVWIGCSNSGDSGGSDEGDTYSEMRDEIVAINEKMSSILDGIETPEDAAEADKDIGEVYDRMFDVTKETLVDTTKRAVLQEIQTDSAVHMTNLKVDDQIEALKGSHPEASAKLSEVLGKHSLRMNQRVNEFLAEQDEKK